MLENLYDLGWGAEFKNLVTPDMIASMFRVGPAPFGVPFKKNLARLREQQNQQQTIVGVITIIAISLNRVIARLSFSRFQSQFLAAVSPW